MPFVYVLCIYVLFADFSIRLNRLKDIPTTLKPCCYGNSGGDTNDSNIDDAICKYLYN